jgi:hypothetical protein
MNRFMKHTIVMLIVLVAAICLEAVTATAAPADFQGAFQLPIEVRWGKAVLPAGDYLLRVEYSGPVTLVTIGERKSRKTIAFIASQAAESHKDRKQESALLIGTREGRPTVHSLRLTGLDVVLLFDPALARRSRVEEAGKSQAIPVVADNPSSSPSPAPKGNSDKNPHKTKEKSKGESHENHG